jgi:acyl-CoA reductase-like NAD-dependent aldehyde dehydrogenase
MTALHSSAEHAARSAQHQETEASEWASVSVRRRIQRACALRHVLAENAQAFVRAVALSRPRSLVETVSGELIPLSDACRYLEKNAEGLLRPRRLGVGSRPLWLWGVGAEIRREPLGLVLIIAPGNYPLMLPGIQVVAALVAGNRVLLKPAPGTGGVARLLCESLYAQGVPPDALVLLEEAPEAITPWVSRVDKVFMTASETSGKAVLRQLTEHVVPAVMELSGCDAMFILPGADLDLASAALRFGLTFNDSQTCMAPRRVFIHEAMADALSERLIGSLAGCRSRTTSPAAIELLNDLGGKALEGGAVLLTGTLPFSAGSGPLVFDRTTPSMPLLQRDVMAPVVSIVRVRSPEQALSAYEQCEYRLGASVFGPVSAARAFATRIPAGSVVVNDLIVPTADPRLPLSPRRHSGFGATRGAAGLLEMTRIKTVSVRRGRPAHLRPDADHAGPLLLAYLQATHGRKRAGRLKSWRALLREGWKLSRQ